MEKEWGEIRMKTANEVVWGEKRADLSFVLRPADTHGIYRGKDNKLVETLVRYRPCSDESDEDENGVHIRIAGKCELFGQGNAAFIFIAHPEWFERSDDGYHRLAVCAECDGHFHIKERPIFVYFGDSEKWDSALEGPAFFCDIDCLIKFEADNGDAPAERCHNCGEKAGESLRFVHLPGEKAMSFCGQSCVVEFYKRR